MRINRHGVAVAVLALLLVGAACSDDSDDSSTSTTDETTTTTEATTTQPSATVDYNFDTPPSSATNALETAKTMERRLDKAGYPGSEAVVNADGTGLEITVVGVETEDAAKAEVDNLTFIGQVYYRPVMEGPIPPGPGETAAAASTEVLGADPTSTSLPGSDEPTTTQDDPNGTSLLAWYDSPERTNVIARYSVGPQVLDGTGTTEGIEVTTSSGNPAVQIRFKKLDLSWFNALASACYHREPSCAGGSAPGPGAYAIQYDDVIAVVSVPRGGQETFTPFTQDDVIIHSPHWGEEHVAQIALALEAGALPVGLTAA
jgi:hypothetical protein